MSVQTELAKLGSGVGLIYLTDVNDNIIDSGVYPNDDFGRELAEKRMIVSSPLTSNISATATVTITAGGGTITNLTYNGVSVFDTSSPVGGASPADTAINLRDAINAYVSSPEYTAVANGNSVIVYLDPSLGSTLNGSVGTISVTATTAATTTDLEGGTNPSDLVDSQIGIKMYVNASSGASETSIVGATDITTGVLRKSASTPFTIEQNEIASGVISPSRDGNITVIAVQTEGAVAADNLDTIDAGIFASGDILIIRGLDAAKVTTVTESGNIELANNSVFLTGDKDNVLMLQYDNTTTPTWYEINRSPSAVISVSSFRSGGIAQPVEGVNTTALATTGGTINLTAGTDKGVQVLTGSGTLTSSWTIALNAGLIEGDTFVIDYNATFTPSGNTVTIAGITLTDSQIAEGNVSVEAVWDGSSWITTMIRNTATEDLATDTDLATKEDSLGNPASDGYILSSTAAGVRSWIPSTSDVVLDGNASTNSSSAGTETTLRTITVPANTLSTDGSSIQVDCYGDFAANANAKTLRIKFNGTTIDSNVFTASPNGVRFQAHLNVSRSSNTIAKCTGSIMINGAVTEVDFVQVGSLDLAATSYDITITGQGTGASDVNVYSSIAKKYIV